MKIHFLGICGTAMASVAALLKEKGYVVSGSDENVYPPMSDFLRERGISIASPFAEENLWQHEGHEGDANPDTECRGNDTKKQLPDLIVIGNAIKRGNPEVEAVLERKLRFVSLPEVVKEFLIRGKTSIVITGTHGKTTTTALTAWIFEHAGLDPGFLIGGIPLNFGHGAKAGRDVGRLCESAGQSDAARRGERPTTDRYFIIEGDEYDTAFFDKRSKFVHYLPDIVVINNIEFDHADIFDSVEAIQRSFRQLIRIIPRNGLLLANGDDANVRAVLAGAPCPVKTFGLSENNDIRAEQLQLNAQRSTFNIQPFVRRGELRAGCSTTDAPRFTLHASRSTFSVPLVGEFNVRNTLAATAVALHCGIAPEKIQDALATFRGIKRRMEVRGEIGGVTVIDDFAHHPTALRETIKALRVRFPGRRLWALFEPRSNTTRRHFFQRELTEALALADGIFIGRIDRLNELAEKERLAPEKMIAEIHAQGRLAHYTPQTEELIALLVPQLQTGDVIAIFSNGKFDGIHEKLLAALRAKSQR